jgi:glutathione peroxidase
MHAPATTGRIAERIRGPTGGERRGAAFLLPMNRSRLPSVTIISALACFAACSQPDHAADATAAPRATIAATEPETAPTMSADDFYALTTQSLDGAPVDLATYRGKVALVVNVASECGYTPQYTGLQALHEGMQDRGLVVLGFPSNDFGGQEPGTAAEIRQFCTTKYSVTFPLFAKVQTKAGAGQSPVYARLAAATGKLPSWNFCKYLVGKDGTVLGFWPAGTRPDDAALRRAIEAAL